MYIPVWFLVVLILIGAWIWSYVPKRKTAVKKPYRASHICTSITDRMTPQQVEAWRKGPTDTEKLEAGLRTGDIVGVEIL